MVCHTVSARLPDDIKTRYDYTMSRMDYLEVIAQK